jgi:hypothetical protein
MLVFSPLFSGSVSDIFEFSDSRLAFSEFQIPSAPFIALATPSPVATFLVISDVPFIHIPGMWTFEGIWRNAAFVAIFSVIVVLVGVSCVLLVMHLVRRWRLPKMYSSIEREMMDDIDGRYLGPEPGSCHD